MPTVSLSLTGSAVAALRSQSVLFVHIPSSDDAEMTRLEQRLRDLNGEVDHSLASARQSGQAWLDRLATASQAWSEYQRVATEVLRLSRENSNVISFDLSVHEKRHATKECLSALSALLAAIDVGPHAPR